MRSPHSGSAETIVTIASRSMGPAPLRSLEPAKHLEVDLTETQFSGLRLHRSHEDVAHPTGFPFSDGKTRPSGCSAISRHAFSRPNTPEGSAATRLEFVVFGVLIFPR